MYTPELSCGIITTQVKRQLENTMAENGYYGKKRIHNEVKFRLQN